MKADFRIIVLNPIETPSQAVKCQHSQGPNVGGSSQVPRSVLFGSYERLGPKSLRNFGLGTENLCDAEVDHLDALLAIDSVR